MAELEKRLVESTKTTEIELCISMLQKEIELLENHLTTKRLELIKLEERLDTQGFREMDAVELIQQLKHALILNVSLTNRFGPVQYADLGYYFDEDGDGIKDLQIAWGWSKRRVPKLGWEK